MAVRKRPVVDRGPSRKASSDIQQSQEKGPTDREAQRDTSGIEFQGMASLLKGQPAWVVLAIASGGCAAINGVFAKLTTTSLTSNFSAAVSTLLGLDAENQVINVLLRGSFFGLNLLFNGIMWGLFTAALTKGSSTTRVSIVNVSSNFFVTAVLGWLIFSEKLPLQWWLGAALLAAGNVVIGRREEGEKPGGTVGSDESRREALEAEGLIAGDVQGGEGDLLHLDDTVVDGRDNIEEAQRIRRGEDVDAPL